MISTFFGAVPLMMKPPIITLSPVSTGPRVAMLDRRVAAAAVVDLNEAETPPTLRTVVCEAPFVAAAVCRTQTDSPPEMVAVNCVKVDPQPIE